MIFPILDSLEAGPVYDSIIAKIYRGSFDSYNVLLSGMNQIKKYKPVLFFEYMSLNELGYVDLINKLNEIGYKNWSVLNNYGAIIFENKGYIDILNLIKLETKNNIILDIYCKWTK